MSRDKKEEVIERIISAAQKIAEKFPTQNEDTKRLIAQGLQEQADEILRGAGNCDWGEIEKAFGAIAEHRIDFDNTLEISRKIKGMSNEEINDFREWSLKYTDDLKTLIAIILQENCGCKLRSV